MTKEQKLETLSHWLVKILDEKDRIHQEIEELNKQLIALKEDEATIQEIINDIS